MRTISLRIPVVALLACLTGCSSKSDGAGTNVDEFARFWADCAPSCHQQEACGIGDEAQCKASCAPADVIKAAIVGAAIAPDDLRRCQEAQGLVDTCLAGQTCTGLLADPSPCAVQYMAAGTNCSLVSSAVDLHVKAHPVTPYFGDFVGTYAGSESGSFGGTIYPWGPLGATISSPTLGIIQAVGSVAGVSLTASGTTANGATTFTLTGMLSGTAGADAGATGFEGSGAWQSSAGGSGTFELQAKP